MVPESPLAEWGVAGLVHPGQVESGDRAVFAPFDGGLLLGAVDGLGHGEEASAAAGKAVDCLESHRTEPLISLVRRCQSRLQGTRGVVMSLAVYSAHDQKLTWIGIGNVEGVLLRGNSRTTPSFETLWLRGGVVGYQLPTLEASVVRVSPGDTLVFATDGVKRDFVTSLLPGIPPRQMAEMILARHAKGDDDALVLAARFSRRERETQAQRSD
jgi:hypothetical protein